MDRLLLAIGFVAVVLWFTISLMYYLKKIPINEYLSELNRIPFYYYKLEYGKHTTSLNTANGVCRELIESERFMEPDSMNERFELVHKKYIEKYPNRIDDFPLREFKNDSLYHIGLANKSNYNVFSFTWDEMITHNPKRERALLTTQLREEIKKRDNYTCCNCKKDLSSQKPYELHIDHIKPISKGGKTEPENLQLLCYSCNLTKGSSYDETD